MLTQWRKFKGWLILEYFLRKPNIKIHIKELSRVLGVSPRTADEYLKLYAKDRILKSKRIGNLIQFYLNNNSPFVKSLKSTYFLMYINNANLNNFLEENNIISFAVYGSFSTGEYTEKSDIDLILISPKKKIDLKDLSFLEELFNAEIDVQIYTLGEWRRMHKQNKEFVEQVKSTHTLIYGAEL